MIKKIEDFMMSHPGIGWGFAIGFVIGKIINIIISL